MMNNFSTFDYSVPRTLLGMLFVQYMIEPDVICSTM